MDKRLKLILEKIVKVLDDDEVDIVLNEMGLDKLLVLPELADDVKNDERVIAHIKAIDAAQDNGDGVDKAMDDILTSKSDMPVELYDKLHPKENNDEIQDYDENDTGDLYTDEEKTALGSIADAIRDRWQ